MLEGSPDYRREHHVPVQNAIRQQTATEAEIDNDSLAQKRYLDSVVRQHRYIRFAGMAEVSGPAEVEMVRAFVTTSDRAERPHGQTR